MARLLRSAFCFRPGAPILPLLDYRDAFLEGDSPLTGLYNEEAIKPFTERLAVEADMVEYGVAR